jgi:outer membrane lipoprotein SlyB
MRKQETGQSNAERGIAVSSFVWRREAFMKRPKWILSTLLMGSMCVPVASFAAPAGGQSRDVNGHYYATNTPRRHYVKRRSKKKSAAIVGGSALGGAAIGGLVGGGKGAAIGALAGGGGGYVYDRKSQHKAVVPK